MYYSFTDCNDVYDLGATTSGVYTIQPSGAKKPIRVYCVIDDVSGDTWTVLQRRVNSDVNFLRNYKQYEQGFGDLKGSHWLGLDSMHLMTKQKKYRMKMEVLAIDPTKGDVWLEYEYENFAVDSAANKYRLAVSGYSGFMTLDAMDHHHNQWRIQGTRCPPPGRVRGWGAPRFLGPQKRKSSFLVRNQPCKVILRHRVIKLDIFE